MEEQTQLDTQNDILIPTRIAFWICAIGIPIAGWFLPLTINERRALIYLSVAAWIYVAALIHWLVPKYKNRFRILYPSVILAIIFIAAFSYIFEPYGLHTEILYVTVIVGVGVIGGKKIALHTAIFASIAEAVTVTLLQEKSMSLYATLAVRSLAMLFAGYTAGYFTGKLYDTALFANRQNHHLSALLKSGIITTQPEELDAMLPQIAKIITQDVPVTTCQIMIQSPKDGLLTIYDTYPIRPIASLEINQTKEISVHSLPRIQKILQSGKYMIIKKDEYHEQDSNFERTILFNNRLKAICLVPLIAKGNRLGVIVAGEERHWDREPFTPEKVDLLQAMASQIAAAVHSTRLYLETQRQTQRLAVLNEVAKAIGSTIEMDDLLELIYDQLSKVILTDTYFVSIYFESENILELRILFDEGHRYPPEKIPLGLGLSGWIAENKQPLLINNMDLEINSLPVKPVQSGSKRISKSWLGIPMLIGERFLGIIAIASYTAHAFDEEDKSLLSNLAAQAALAIDNARQHEEVKEQARRDSLTGAFNHGYLLLRLYEEVAHARTSGDPVSLIMIDIDYFKEYNDQFGHLVGDDVLRKLVQSIMSNIKPNDFIGRWGGEEFAVVLTNTSIEQAMKVADQIRATLTKIKLTDRLGRPLPNPTISQGIATSPTHTVNGIDLVDIADQALYIAKNKGRDQIIATSQ